MRLLCAGCHGNFKAASGAPLCEVSEVGHVLLNKPACAGLECKKTRGLQHEGSALELKTLRATVHHCKYISLLFLHVDRLQYWVSLSHEIYELS